MKLVRWLMGLCSIGILIHVLLVNVCSCGGTQGGYERAKGLHCGAFLGCCMQLSLARKAAWLLIRVQSQLGIIHEVRADWFVPPITDARHN